MQVQPLRTVEGVPIVIKDYGKHNHLAGPDFFNARIKIGDQLWARNVEMHLRSSDWYVHHHETDEKYNTVILHVVWEDDANIFRTDKSKVPTLQLKDYIPQSLLNSYGELFSRKRDSFINCGGAIKEFDDFKLQNWLERLYFERLESRSVLIAQLLKEYKHDWEQVLFLLLIKSFGTKINGDAFFEIGKAIPYSIVRKLNRDERRLESMLMGTAGFLEDESILDDQYLDLKKEYNYLTVKYGFSGATLLKPDFFKLRPQNFPTIRLSQVAALYAKQEHLFSKLMGAETLDEIYDLLTVTASSYWTTHFTFGKVSKKQQKKVSRSLVELIIVNAILPLKFCYYRSRGKEGSDVITGLATALKPEQNSVISNFENLGVSRKSGMDSQGLLQLYNSYCTKNKCLQCPVGISILGRNN
ncbi:MAG: GTPase SAR1 family protein [Psychroserpens sp.]